MTDDTVIVSYIKLRFEERLAPLMPPEQTWRMVHAKERLDRLIKVVADVIETSTNASYSGTASDTATVSQALAIEALREELGDVEKPRKKSEHCGCRDHAEPDFCVARCAKWGCSDFGIDPVPES